MNRHPVDRGQAIVIGKMKDDNVENQRGMSGFNFMLRSEIDRDAVFPLFQFLIKITNGVQ